MNPGLLEIEAGIIQTETCNECKFQSLKIVIGTRAVKNHGHSQANQNK
jgi:hypothetical protein